MTSYVVRSKLSAQYFNGFYSALGYLYVNDPEGEMCIDEVRVRGKEPNYIFRHGNNKVSFDKTYYSRNV